MYCPKCSQQQVDDNVRYCSRCGFPLGAVSELLASGGTAPLVHMPSGSSKLSPRQKGIRQGAMIMLSTMLIVPLVIFLLVAMMGLPGELIPLTAVLLFMGGLLRILYAVFLQENGASVKQDATPGYVPPPAPARLSTPARGSALPPAQGTPAAPAWRRPANTSELVSPPSVTENTTRLLDERPDQHETR
jgi:hypothetical protein